jgi:diacylglycerol O-acyltransferase / wax synthase
VEGLEAEHFALLNKTHHCLVDGISGVDITTVLFDVDPVPAEAPPPEGAWEPRREPSDVELVAHGVGDLVRTPVGLAGDALGALRRPGAPSSACARRPRAWARWRGGS